MNEPTTDSHPVPRSLVVVAQRDGAEFWLLRDHRSKLEHLGELAHPDGRALDQDLVTDDPGRSKERMGPQQRAVPPTTQPTEQLAERFADAVLERVNTLAPSADHGVLLAGPTFLGTLRERMDDTQSAFFTHEVPKNLANEPRDDLRQRLVKLLEDEKQIELGAS